MGLARVRGAHGGECFVHFFDGHVGEGVAGCGPADVDLVWCVSLGSRSGESVVLKLTGALGTHFPALAAAEGIFASVTRYLAGERLVVGTAVGGEA